MYMARKKLNWLSAIAAASVIAPIYVLAHQLPQIHWHARIPREPCAVHAIDLEVFHSLPCLAMPGPTAHHLASAHQNAPQQTMSTKDSMPCLSSPYHAPLRRDPQNLAAPDRSRPYPQRIPYLVFPCNATPRRPMPNRAQQSPFASSNYFRTSNFDTRNLPKRGRWSPIPTALPA